MNRGPSRIAIVGAGIAGVSCATALHKAGFQTHVFEKSSGPAGRMSTRRGNDWQCDHGAPCFTARHPDFRAEVARWQNAGVAGLWTPRLQMLGEPPPKDPDQGLERFVGIPSMTAPARFLATDLALTPNTTIQKIRRDSDGWRLCSTEHGWHDATFNSVVVAVPAPQVVTLLQHPAPALAAVARRAVMRGCWALMMRFASPVELPFDAAVAHHGPIRWLARDSSKPGRSGPETWALHASADWSEAHLEREGDWVASTLLARLIEQGFPQPQAWTAHRWRYANAEQSLNRDCVWEPASGVGLCGDWLNDGTVQGAWLSGKALAQQLARTHQDQPAVP